MSGKNKKELTIIIKPTVKSYTFIINGYELTIVLTPKDTVGFHPLDILQDDLQDMVAFLKVLERFKNVAWEGKDRLMLESPARPGQEKGGDTVEGFIEKHKPPSSLSDKCICAGRDLTLGHHPDCSYFIDKDPMSKKP